MSAISPQEAGITSKRGEPPKEGTQRILLARDVSMATAFNQNVKAIRELQAIVTELLARVDELESNTGTSCDES